MTTDSPNLNIYDADHTIRRLAARIGKRNGVGGTTGAIRFALNFTEQAQKVEPTPLDYTKCTSAELEALIVHGVTWKVRSDALRAMFTNSADAAQKEAEAQS